MRIIPILSDTPRNPAVESAAEPLVVPIPEPPKTGNTSAPLTEALEQFKRSTLVEFLQLHELYQQQNRDIVKLTEDIAALNKQVEELEKKAEQPAAKQRTEPPNESKKVDPVPPQKMSPPAALSPQSAALLPEDPERKIAIFSKLWDYLNQPAFKK